MDSISFSPDQTRNISVDSRPYGLFLRLVSTPWQGWYLEESTLSPYEIDADLHGGLS
jgi:hypothetical protein